MPFDDDFVAGATRREESAEERADRAARIARSHRLLEEQGGGWRTPDRRRGPAPV